MIFDFLKKQKKAKEKLKLTQIAIINLQIPEAQKSLYLQAIEVLDEEGINKIYSTLVNFIETVEMKQLDEIQKNNFSIVAGMKKKEAEEKRKEINSFSFLINNV